MGYSRSRRHEIRGRSPGSAGCSMRRQSAPAHRSLQCTLVVLKDRSMSTRERIWQRTGTSVYTATQKLIVPCSSQSLQTLNLLQPDPHQISHGLNGLNGLNPFNPFNPWLISSKRIAASEQELQCCLHHSWRGGIDD